MERAKICRIDVDTQYGFCDPNGRLYVHGAELIIPNVVKLNNDATKRGLVLIGSVDAHNWNSPEFQKNGGPFPPHCMVGTKDFLKLPETLPFKSFFVDKFPYKSGEGSIYEDAAVVGDFLGDVAIYFQKDLYSIFDNPSAESLIASLYEDLDFEFQVYGVATDYCVSAAALGIKKRWPDAKVTVVTDAIEGVATETTVKAIGNMAKANIEFKTTAELVEG